MLMNVRWFAKTIRPETCHPMSVEESFEKVCIYRQRPPQKYTPTLEEVKNTITKGKPETQWVLRHFRSTQTGL